MCGKKTALNLRTDNDTLKSLELAAVAQRIQMLKIGHELNIRLHYGAMMSCVEILTILYLRWMNYKPEAPDWALRDRFILSKGHAAPALYVALAHVGFFKKREFRGFRKLNSILQGHPDRNKTPGVDCSTGSLGQGFPVACGMALGAKMDGASFKVYTLLSDGECNEGSTWEAALIASNKNLKNVIALLDWNKKSSYGPMKGRNDIEPLAKKWKAFGWSVQECDGHNFVAITKALEGAEANENGPSVILCHTVKGKGIPYAETNPTRSNFYLEKDQYIEALDYQNDLQEKIENGI